MFYKILANTALYEFLEGTAIGVGAAIALMLLLALIIGPAQKRKKEAVKETAYTAKDIIPDTRKSARPPPRAQASAQAPPPAAKLLTLSRYDVFDCISEMRGNAMRFPVIPNATEKTGRGLPDYLRCGERCFGLMYGRGGIVFHFILRLSLESAKRFGEKHPVRRAGFPAGADWYGLIIDSSYEKKSDLYEILIDSYDFAYGEFYAGTNATHVDEAVAEQARIEGEASENAAPNDKTTDVAEARYRAGLERLKTEYFTNFYITRQEIADDTKKMGITDITVVERPKQPQLPVSLKYKGKTYAMLYGTDKGVLMIARFDEEYAGELARIHPEICRAGFPRGANWYSLPVDGAFREKESVYRVLTAARFFVRGGVLISKQKNNA